MKSWADPSSVSLWLCQTRTGKVQSLWRARPMVYIHINVVFQFRHYVMQSTYRGLCLRPSLVLDSPDAPTLSLKITALGDGWVGVQVQGQRSDVIGG